MLCRVEMPGHEALFGRFYRWKLLHLGKPGGKGSFWGIPVLTAIVIALLLVTGMPLPFVFFLLLVLAAYLIYSLYIMPLTAFRRKEGAALQTHVYVFTETGFTRSVRGEDGSVQESSSSQYAALESAVETAKDFYLFTGPGQAFLVDKEYFTNGTPNDLRAILQKALGSAFKPRK